MLRLGGILTASGAGNRGAHANKQLTYKSAENRLLLLGSLKLPAHRLVMHGMRCCALLSSLVCMD